MASTTPTGVVVSSGGSVSLAASSSGTNSAVAKSEGYHDRKAGFAAIGLAVVATVFAFFYII